MKKTFKLSVVALNCEQEFEKGMGPGVLATQEVEFDLTQEEYDSSRFSHQLYSMAQEFMSATVDWKVEEKK
jgi:hypothetical protein